MKYQYLSIKLKENNIELILSINEIKNYLENNKNKYNNYIMEKEYDYIIEKINNTNHGWVFKITNSGFSKLNSFKSEFEINESNPLKRSTNTILTKKIKYLVMAGFCFGIYGPTFTFLQYLTDVIGANTHENFKYVLHAVTGGASLFAGTVALEDNNLKRMYKFYLVLLNFIRDLNYIQTSPRAMVFYDWNKISENKLGYNNKLIQSDDSPSADIYIYRVFSYAHEGASRDDINSLESVYVDAHDEFKKRYKRDYKYVNWFERYTKLFETNQLKLKITRDYWEYIYVLNYFYTKEKFKLILKDLIQKFEYATAGSPANYWGNLDTIVNMVSDHFGDIHNYYKSINTGIEIEAWGNGNWNDVNLYKF